MQFQASPSDNPVSLSLCPKGGGEENAAKKFGQMVSLEITKVSLEITSGEKHRKDNVITLETVDPVDSASMFMNIQNKFHFKVKWKRRRIELKI